ncbi:MAG TPA: 30S ribosomal protein S21 [Flavilitoribacter sp.]|nr:30S ribosomal protein S21 [Lewinella sp.]MCB9281210.1 30S ribosomal protein S21 [Lewinellaceae bacterium]HMQ61768.1 30S ribosomal protein S21 [Flavilitoribacter sp.]HMQ90913.1 30S ribosomal protein S21 [Flavilitoribacter sp.]
MLIIEVKDNESIDRALKRYKRKHQRVKLKQELLRRKHYTKPSVKRRNELLDAIYREQKKQDQDY